MAKPDDVKELIEEIKPESILPDPPPLVTMTGTGVPIPRRNLDSLFTSRSKLLMTGDRVPPWWTPDRDVFLWRTCFGSDVLSSAIYSTCARLVSTPVSITPKDKSNRNQRNLAAWSEMLLQHYWTDEVFKFALDWQTQDNGAFMEIMGGGDPSGPIEPTPIPGTSSFMYGTGLRTLDAQNCTRTGVPEYPVVYKHRGPDSVTRYYKFHHTRIMYASQMPSTRQGMYEVGFCLHGDSAVKMADGSTKRIRDIVRDRDPGPVVSVKNGKVVSRKITNWYENERGNRELINIRGVLSSQSTGIKNKNSWVTEDHPVLTPDGWKPAGELITGDKVVTGIPSPNRKQESFLVGAILGDGCIRRRKEGQNPQLLFGQGEAQRDWLKLKVSALSRDFDFTESEGETSLRYKGVTTRHVLVRAESKCSPGFHSLREEFYKSNRKVFPSNLVRKNMSPILLATWYMDDGNICHREENKGNNRPEARIATNGYTVAEVEEMVSILCESGYESTVISARGDENKRNIRIRTESSQKFFDDIAPYVPECMRYKIPKNSRPFDPSLWDLGKADVLLDEVVVRRGYDRLDSRTGKAYNPSKVYCISVDETENFVTSNIAVHNCGTSRCIHNALRLDDIRIFEDETLGVRPATQLMFGKTISGEQMEEAFKVAETKALNSDKSRSAYMVFMGVQGNPETVRAADVKIIDLKKYPDGYNPEMNMNIAMNVIAMALGFDSREFWPATVRGATRADAEVQDRKANNKTHGIWRSSITALLNQKWCGAMSCQATFDKKDEMDDILGAEIVEIRAKSRSSDLTAGILDKKVIWQQMLENAEINEDQYNYLLAQQAAMDAEAARQQVIAAGQNNGSNNGGNGNGSDGASGADKPQSAGEATPAN